MTPIQKLVAIALPLISHHPLQERADMLEAASAVFGEETELARLLRAEAVCHRHADAHQQTWKGLLNESTINQPTNQPTH